jgi:hypothetical protein
MKLMIERSITFVAERRTAAIWDRELARRDERYPILNANIYSTGIRWLARGAASLLLFVGSPLEFKKLKIVE